MLNALLCLQLSIDLGRGSSCALQSAQSLWSKYTKEQRSYLRRQQGPLAWISFLHLHQGFQAHD